VFKTTRTPAKKGTPTSDRSAAFVADERTNSIIMVASEDDTNRIRSLIETLDQETPKGKEKSTSTTWNMRRRKRSLPSSKTSPKPKPKTGGAKEAPVVSDKVTITADKATNSLIITADRDDYATLVEIIRQIDIPRAMVYIEALIMEVNAEKSFDLGTEWVVGDDVGFETARESSAAVSPPDESLLSFDDRRKPGSASLASGFSMGLFGESVEIDGISFPSYRGHCPGYTRKIGM
jgi:general secretion pathway protein D